MRKQSLRILVPVVLLAATTAAGAMEDTFRGFYAGVGVGGSFLSGRESVDQSASSASLLTRAQKTLGNSSQRGLTKNSVAGNLFLGYGSTWDPLYLGIEASVTGTRARTKNRDTQNLQLVPLLTSTTTSTLVTNTQTRLRPWDLGLDLRPGVLLRPETLLYGRVGVAWNKLSVRSTQTYNDQVSQVGTTSFNLPALSQTTRKHKNNTSLRLGAGLEQEICENLVIRGDYVHIWDRKARLSSTASQQVTAVPPGGDTITMTASNSVRSRKVGSNTVMLGVSYYWQ